MTIHSIMVLWLLRQSGIAEKNQPIIGDLLEEFASGRSARWLWWQALAIVMTNTAEDLRHHKRLALRAVGVGLLVILAATVLKYRITSQPWASGLLAFRLLTLLSFLLAGWAIGLTHRNHKLAMLFAFAVYAGFAKTWLYTTHFHRYWKEENPSQLLMDVGLTALGLFFVAVGGLLPEPRVFRKPR